MPITVKQTNGTVLTTIIDGTIDQTTDLTLIGRNFSGFGEYLNEDFVRLLENFANVTAPEHPIYGQIWYDTSEARLKVYSEVKTAIGTTGLWKAAGGTIVSQSSPLSFTTGDIWIDSTEQQMHFYDGTNLLLAGPLWKKSQGRTGFEALTLLDSNNNPYSVLVLYVKDFMMGIFSAVAFTPSPAIQGFGSLIKGFNSNSLVGSIFDTTVTNANELGGIASSLYVRSDVNTTMKGQLFIQNDSGITIGSSQNGRLSLLTKVGSSYVSTTTLSLENVNNDGDIALKTNNVNGLSYPIYAKASTAQLGIFTNTPSATMDVNGDVRVRGNLTVEGTTEYIESTTVRIADKNIEIGSVSVPTDSTADGGGIIIKGTTDKTISYNNTTKAFDFSENINIPLGKTFKINNVALINGNALSNSITSATGLTSIGALSSLSVGNLQLSSNNISNTIPNQNIQLSVLGTGIIQLVGTSTGSTARIAGLADPINPQDASTKIYTETYAKTLPLSITVVDNGILSAINGKTVSLLTDIANPLLFANGKVAYVHYQHIDFVTPTITRYLKKFVIVNGAWQFDSDLTSSI